MSRILIIEDNHEMLTILVRVLTGAGHDVRGVRDGRQGLLEVAAWPVEIVVTDIVMPEIDGLEIIMAIKRDHPCVRIIAISGGGIGTSSDYMSLALMLGAHRTMQKPFTAASFLAVIEEEAVPGLAGNAST
jgi:DNA-binding response OmpR family regulator